jgi:2-methylcitrate dehydratase PrpD
MSTPFCIALALITGNIGLTSFTEEALQNPDIMALTQKIAVRADEEMTSWVPKKRAARVTVTMADGKTYTAQADFALGEPELPMSIEDFEAKVTELCVYAGRTEQNAREIIHKVLTDNGNAADLVKMLA